jgi:phosphatidylserine decarboxylase
MRIHKEGYVILIVLGALLVIFNVASYFFIHTEGLSILTFFVSLIVYGLILQFFRNPNRDISYFDNRAVYAPADGKVVVIEEVYEAEYFKDKRIQVSIFMSPINVHVNRNPIGGKVSYYKYHEGKYLVAWHPKSSTENERTTVVISNGHEEILFRQVAGALAKRIKCYLKQGQEVKQGADMGFIKFGSRVDVYLPLNANIEVKIGDIVYGNRNIIAMLV